MTLDYKLSYKRLVMEDIVTNALSHLLPYIVTTARNESDGSTARQCDTGRALFGSESGGYGDDCCPPVVDPYTWLALIGAIALATYFLRVAIVVKFGRRKRREVGHVTLSSVVITGRGTCSSHFLVVFAC